MQGCPKGCSCGVMNFCREHIVWSLHFGVTSKLEIKEKQASRKGENINRFINHNHICGIGISERNGIRIFLLNYFLSKNYA